jgi:hypothetical protein
VDLFRPFAHWLNDRRSARTANLPEGYVDVITLSERRLIRIQGTGDSIFQTQASVTSRVRTPLKIRIPLGTYFVSPGTFQNMVARRQYEFELGPRATQHISIATSCMNPRLAVPNSADRFLGVARAQEELCRFLQAAVHEHFMTVQAGVWAVTSGYTREMIQHRLRKRDVRQEVDPEFSPPSPAGAQPRYAPAIADEQIDRAAALLTDLGIPHRLKSQAEMLSPRSHMLDHEFDLEEILRQDYDEAIHDLAEVGKGRAA